MKVIKVISSTKLGSTGLGLKIFTPPNCYFWVLMHRKMWVGVLCDIYSVAVAGGHGESKRDSRLTLSFSGPERGENHGPNQ